MATRIDRKLPNSPFSENIEWNATNRKAELYIKQKKREEETKSKHRESTIDEEQLKVSGLEENFRI